MDDDLIGTQAPRGRITDPAEAVHRLERAVPDLARYRRPEPAPIAWSTVEEDLGTALPSDYKHLAEYYPSFTMSHDFIHVGLPQPGRERENAGVFEGLVILQDWWEADMSLGMRPYPAPGGLFPFNDTVVGDFILWRTVGTPDDWTVTVANRDGGWWHYSAGVVQFLAELVDGTLEPWGLPVMHTDARAAHS
ncbi:SMI1/KNR4 family protein [Streptomyces malaysiense]|uniref:SMI1/KNR4 family protein n=1 Tax=Streptomyces malaysiense TaxID=1428626 RepID=A0A1J4Q1J7_9ACTN|nr:SMI1/KNR4 family protein [Streptomyces malaysiense]OIK27005.1 hypothetical protein VT52_013560 [Streptomyces malaysiense]